MRTKKRTFKSNLYYIFLISILLPCIIGCITFTIYYTFIFEEQNNHNIFNVLNSVTNSIGTQIDELNTIATTCYMHSNILDAIQSFNNPDLYSYYDSIQLNHLENNYSDAMTKLMFTAQSSIYNISFFPISKESTSFFSLSKNFAGVRSISFENYHEQDWFQTALKSDGDLIIYPPHIPHYLGTDSVPTIFSALKLIINIDSKKSIGILKIDSKITNLEHVFSSIEMDSNAHLLLIDASGNIIASNGPFSSQTSIIPKTNTLKLDGITYKCVSKRLPNTNWTLLYLSSVHTLIYYITLGITIFLLCMLASLILAFITYHFEAHSLLTSIANITTTIKQIEEGNLDVYSKVHSNNELEIISDALNKMTAKLKLYINNEYITVINQQKAEYKALQSQINPHFLYNTLNGFIALNRMGEKKKLEKSIISLTHLFRYTCHPQDTTALSNELNFIDEYLKLQKLKYDDRLEFSLQVDPLCLSFQIPKLLLQPIVENSIIHGLEPTADTIHIHIMCNETYIKGIGSAVFILITDDGVGYDCSKMTASDNVGTQNVEARVSLFNKDALYYCTSEPTQGIQTLFVFPLNDDIERND